MEEGLPLVGLTLVRGLDFTSRLHGKSQPGLAGLIETPELTTFIYPRNTESDICILYPTPKQTEPVKCKVL